MKVFLLIFSFLFPCILFADHCDKGSRWGGTLCRMNEFVLELKCNDTKFTPLNPVFDYGDNLPSMYRQPIKDLYINISKKDKKWSTLKRGKKDFRVPDYKAMSKHYTMDMKKINNDTLLFQYFYEQGSRLSYKSFTINIRTLQYLREENNFWEGLDYSHQKAEGICEIREKNHFFE